MLIEFTVANYRSFKDATTFSMIKAPDKSKESVRHPDNVFEVNKKLTLLKSAAIYGANASGKSNLLKAMAFVKDFVLKSVDRPPRSKIEVESFRLSTETESAPSCFEIVLWLDDKQYRYGFKANRECIHEEWLYHTKQRETQLFYRQGTKIDIAPRAFKEGERLADKTRPEALFLSVVAKFNGEISKRIFGWFEQFDVIPFNIAFDVVAYRVILPTLIKDKRLNLTELVELIKPLDVGIADVLMTQAPLSDNAFQQDLPAELAELKEVLLKHSGVEVTKFLTLHNQYDQAQNSVGTINFELTEHESAGTQKLFGLAGLILVALKQGHILILDELDTQLHPLVTRELIDLFHSTITNPHNAQLIFTTHDTTLLDSDMFRSDQIWFTEKDRYGVTNLYSLVEFKNVRDEDDAHFEKQYIIGKYGAIPYTGNVAAGVRHGE